MANDPLTTAKIIADTKSRAGVRITTFEITYPRVILAEVNTHRLLSKSSASSRAIPVVKRLEAMDAGMVWKPQFDGAVANKPGMQSTEKLADDMVGPARMIWDDYIYEAMEAARQLNATGVHKQYVNRMLEPFMYQKTVVTSTEWDNYFKLRDHSDAQPEFQDLAGKMKLAFERSTPKLARITDGIEVHLPYYDESVDGAILSSFATNNTTETAEGAYLVSAARCARVSYNSFETGKRSMKGEDLKLARQLVESGHMSPFDHAAMADEIVTKMSARYWSMPQHHRQFYGWIPHRVEVESLQGYQGRRDSFGEIKNSDLR